VKNIHNINIHLFDHHTVGKMGVIFVTLFLLLQQCHVTLGDKFLIIHPFYSGSHVLTLHHVASALVDRGHQVLKKSIFTKLLEKT
jgi:hypothetical protein